MASFDAAHPPVHPGATGVTVGLTGYGTTWVADAPAFTLSGGAGASIASQSIVDDTHATLALTAGTAPGLLTIGDPSRSTTNTVQVKPPVRWAPRRRR